MAEKEYIERKAIINKIVNTPTVPSRQCYEGNFVYADGVSGRQNEIINYINEQPTADVVPVRHGVWASEETAVTCTACGRSYDTDFEIKRNVIRDFDYCPNCGAKMDGDPYA